MKKIKKKIKIYKQEKTRKEKQNKCGVCYVYMRVIVYTLV